MFGLSLGLDKPYHLLVYVLTVDTPNHSRLRCYQRAALASFGVKPGGHLRVDAGAGRAESARRRVGVCENIE